MSDFNDYQERANDLRSMVASLNERSIASSPAALSHEHEVKQGLRHKELISEIKDANKRIDEISNQSKDESRKNKVRSWVAIGVAVVSALIALGSLIAAIVISR